MVGTLIGLGTDLFQGSVKKREVAKILTLKPGSIELHHGDLPSGLSFSDSVAIDTEAQGLNPMRDRLCLVQLSAGDKICHLVQLRAGEYDAPNLKELLVNPNVTKIFHFARFDMAMLKQYLNIDVNPVFCTKIASKLVRTYTEKHGLTDLTRELLRIEISKEQQSSDWASNELSDEQLSYAATDVLYLHEIRDALLNMLKREGRLALAHDCFNYLSTRVDLDLSGWKEVDIFAHS